LTVSTQSKFVGYLEYVAHMNAADVNIFLARKYIYSCMQVCNSEDPKQVVTTQFFAVLYV